MKLIYSLGTLLLLSCQTHLTMLQTTETQVKEPSDIAIHPETSAMYIVSDKGFLYEVDTQGNIVKKAEKYEGQDNEAVFVKDNTIYTIEERTRNLCIFNSDLQLQRTLNLPYTGGRNKAYESLTYNQAKKVWITITEKNPIVLFELDSEFKVINQIKLTFSRDISGATYHNHNLWLVSDEDRTVYKLNPTTYEVISQWTIPVINPEGIAFTKNGKMLIVSDDRQLIYEFDTPEKP